MRSWSILLLLMLVPSVAAQAPSITMEVSTGEFLLAEGGFSVNGTLRCEAHDPDPDAVYTLAFSATHYVAKEANASGIQIIEPEPMRFEAPCFPGGLAPASVGWSQVIEVQDLNATAGAMYHMDLVLQATATGNLGQTAPESVQVHTMARASDLEAMPEPVDQEPAQQAASAPPAIWLLAVLVLLKRR